MNGNFNYQIWQKSSKYDLSTYNSDEVINGIFDPAFQHLKSWHTDKGSIYDQNVNSNLDFQYHTAYFILSSIIFHYLTSNEKYNYLAQITLDYLTKINLKINKRVNSFIGIGLAFAYGFSSDNTTKEQLARYIDQISFYPTLKQKKKSANNYYALKALSLLLRYGITQNDKDKSDATNLIYNYFTKWQLEDGFFYDSPFTPNCQNGIFHLTYHSTMWMIMSIVSYLLKDNDLLLKSENAFKALESVTSPNGFLSYGRSNNASFGHSSALFACTVHGLFDRDINVSIDSYRARMFGFIKKLQQPDGHFSIVPNTLESSRAGFDKYMFVSVYGSWTLALALLSHIITPLNKT